MARPKNIEKTQKNLIPRCAPDQPGETTTQTVRIKVEDAEWLKTLGGGTSYHVRQAIALYRQHLESES